LPAQRHPGEHERRVRVRQRLAGLARPQVREAHETARVVVLEQDRPGARATVPVGGRQGHRVGLRQPRRDRVGEPRAELGRPVAGQVVLGQAAVRLVLLAQGGQRRQVVAHAPHPDHPRPDRAARPPQAAAAAGRADSGTGSTPPRPAGQDGGRTPARRATAWARSRGPGRAEMQDFVPGLEGVIAFETEIAEPDKEGGALRYRGVDIEDLIGRVSFANVWALLVDGEFGPGLPPAEPFPVPVHSGDVRVDVQSAVAMLAPYYGLGQLLDISDQQARDDLARVSVTALSFVAQSARGLGLPAVPQREVDQAETITERFMRRWRGEPAPRHVRAVDAYWIAAAEHGMNASTLTVRVVASTGADAAACISSGIGALSGPLHGGAPSRVLHMLEEVERTGDAAGYVRSVLDRGERLMGFGHRVYRAEDPRARVLRRTAQQLGAPRYEVAEALEKA